MAYEAYMGIKGSRQGQFKGNISNKWTPVLSFSLGIVSPRDAATGQASGKRQYKPVKVSINWGDASPQIFAALMDAEQLDKVTFTVQGSAPNGQREGFEWIELKNALITNVTTHSAGNKQVQEVSFTYQDVHMGRGQHKTSSDDWEMERFAFTFQKNLASPQLKVAPAHTWHL